MACNIKDEVEIRLAQLSDLNAVIGIGDELFDFPIKIERAKEFFNDPRHHLVIACHDEKIVGIASAFDYVHPDKDSTLFINEVSVLEQYQNKGIGRAMTKYLLSHGKKMGCQDFWVATEHSNVAARKAYISAGGIEDSEPVVLITFSKENIA